MSSVGSSYHNEDPYMDLQRIESFTLPRQPQERSPLFSLIPAEIRDIIYDYVFAEHEDMSREYDLNTCYRRPGYMAPRKTDTTLLRTCQAVYNETWYLPWNNAKHTFYLAWDGRKPQKTTDIHEMTWICAMIERLGHDIADSRRYIPDVQVFAQLCYIQRGDLNPILRIPHFMPRSITITIRHTDFYNWEGDSPLQMDPYWVPQCEMPASVNTVRMQIESPQRKKAQIDYMANRIQNEWYWRRTDNVHLVAVGCQSDSWTGSSIWEGRRWIRDEEPNEPERLRYTIATVSFKAVDQKDDVDGYKRREEYQFPRLDVPLETYKQFMEADDDVPHYIDVHSQ